VYKRCTSRVSFQPPPTRIVSQQISIQLVQITTAIITQQSLANMVRDSTESLLINPFIRPRTKDQRRRDLEEEWNNPDEFRITQMTRYRTPFYRHHRYTVDYDYFRNDLHYFIKTVATHPEIRYKDQETALTDAAHPFHAGQRSYRLQALTGPPPQVGISPELLRTWTGLMSIMCADGLIDAYWG
jgi:hypothetical protein